MNKLVALKRIIEKNSAVKRWRRMNHHNLTVMCGWFNQDLVSVGNYTYGELHVINHSNQYTLNIGHFCSIGPDVTFIVCGDHASNTLSTYPFHVRLGLVRYEATSKGNIIVGSDVWIGTKAIILSGVKIGQGAIVSAGAVVTKDVPPYAIVGGNPARVIKYRFNESQISELMKIDFSKLSLETVKEHIDYFSSPYSEIDDITWLTNTNNS